MINTYLTFSTHKTINSNNATIQVYPKKPLLWPTYMMLAVATISLAFNIAVLSAYCISLCRRKKESGVKTANTIATYQSRTGYLLSAANFIVWLSTSTTFKMMQGSSTANPPPRDLFGFSCSNFVDNLTTEFGKAIPNFDTQCKTQQASFAVGVLNAFLELLGLVINVIVVRRMIHKKKT